LSRKRARRARRRSRCSCYSQVYMSGQYCTYIFGTLYFVLWRTLPVQAGHVAAQPLVVRTYKVLCNFPRVRHGRSWGKAPCQRPTNFALFFCSHRQMAWRLCGRSESNSTSLAKQMVYFGEVGQKMKRTHHYLYSILVFGRDQPLLQNNMHDHWLWSPPQRALDWKANLVQGCARTPPLTRRQPHCFDHSGRATR
jgi:hypothetical protein